MHYTLQSYMPWYMRGVTALSLISIFSLGVISFPIEMLWLLVGREIVEITDDAITISRQILGRRITAIKFRADKINGVFVSSQKDTPFHAGDAIIPYFKDGKIAFNYGKRLFGGVATFRFGSILNNGEAGHLVSTIQNRFPRYRYDPNRAC